MFLSLLFHRITDNRPADFRCVSNIFFENVITTFLNQDVEVKTLSTVMGKCQHHVKLLKCFAVTFDDGWDSDYKIAFPLLVKYQMSATFFLTTDWINTKNRLNTNWIREMHAYGMEIGSHTASHRNLTRLSSSEVYHEMYRSKCMLEEVLGSRINCISIPGGYYSEHVLRMAVKAGYQSVAISRPGINRRNSQSVNRISMHAKTSPWDVKLLFAFPRAQLLKLLVFYYMREMLKRNISIDRYIKLRNRLFTT